MRLDVHNIKGQKTGKSVELPDDIFGIVPNEHAVYLAVKQYLANQRQGTAKTKDRSEVSRSTRKLFRQKGTGGARRGDMKSPLVKGGGTVFGPKPRDYSFRLNKKIRQLARKSALSQKATTGNIVVVEDFTLDKPKTKDFISILAGLSVVGKKPLVVTSSYDPNTYLSSRNIQKVAVLPASDISTYQIMNARTLVLSEGAISKIVETLA
jgi:large subunit ribosomal protein L4